MEMELDKKIRSIARLEEIARLRLNEPVVDDILNEYAREAATEFKLHVGLVTIVMDDALLFAGHHGLFGWIQETMSHPVEWSFCANSVKTEQPFIVEWAPDHPIMKESPLVQLDGVKCYAGCPLVTKNGFIVGNFCIVGIEERHFTDAEIVRLKEYASLAMERLESRVN